MVDGVSSIAHGKDLLQALKTLLALLPSLLPQYPVLLCSVPTLGTSAFPAPGHTLSRDRLGILLPYSILKLTDEFGDLPCDAVQNFGCLINFIAFIVRWFAIHSPLKEDDLGRSQ